MPNIGPITIPDRVSVAAFPLVAAYGSTQVIPPQVAVHRMGAANGKRVQIMKGPNFRRFVAQFAPIGKTKHDELLAWFETTNGQFSYFNFTHRAKDGNVTATVRLADNALSIDLLKGWRSRPQSITFLEVPSTTPTYTVATTLDRFPNSTLNTALLAQVQEIIPLVRIRVTDPAVADIFLSDRLCVVGGTRYEPRILDWGGIGQQIGERSDQATFTLGNADDVFTQLIDAVDLSFAEIRFSLYHVQSQIKVDLWTGFLAADGAWSLNEDPATVELRASDGLASSTAAHPSRAVESRCWKELGGPSCPVSSVGTNAGTPCDKGYDTAAGCVFHGMAAYFGGVIAKSQLVQLKTETSFWGPRASVLSASSVINEGITGRPLKEIYTDVDMPVPCDVLAGRDESEYRAGLGIVGQGPIGAFGADLTRQTLDNVGPHGGNTGLGFRGIRGTDPVTDTTKDRLGLTEARYGWNPPPDSPLAAGVAAIEVRRTDQKGIQGFRPADWAMSSLVSLGLGGWKWTAAGSRVWVSGLTNNVWIAVNIWLKANGAWCDTAHASAVDVATMERFFDVAACIASAGVCDASVPTLVGSGNETQFKFCGILGEFRPVRQWIQDILSAALCDYVFRNGKLRILARVNASAASAFGPGNVIFRSLRREMRVPRFNHLTVEFGDQEYDFGRNGVVLYDEDHGKRRAPNGALPVYTKQTMNPPGVTRKSHASRLCITIAREELGGLTAAEQKRAFNASWRTTILALEVEAGMVVSANGFSRIPDGSKIRVTSWTLNPDYSITIAGPSVTSSMYDYAIGDKPADVEYGPPDIERAPAIRDRRWFPNQIAPDTDDPTLDENDLSFTAGISYGDYADGSKQARLTIQGKPHVNTTLLVNPPQLRTIAFTSTGGALFGTKPLYLCVAPFDSAGRMGPRSRMIMTYLDAATATCAVALSNVTWPSGTWAGYKVYASTEERAVCLQQTVTGSLPSSFTFAGPLKRSTEGPPEAGDKGYHVRAKALLVPGAAKAIVSSLPTTTKVICSALAGTSVDFTGETLMVIGDASEGFPPLRTWTITAWNATTGEFTLERTHAGTDPLQAGDTVLALARATSSSSTTVVCSKLAMADDEHKDAIVRIIYGQGAGQFRRITGNSATTITIDSAWDAAPGTSSFFVIEPGNWQYESPVPAPNITKNDQSVVLQIPVENLEGRTLLAMGFLVDGSGNTGSEDIAPFRLVEVVGAEGVVPGNDPPSAIRTPSIDSIDTTTDPGYLQVTVSFVAPETLNNFDEVFGWLVVDEIEKPIPCGSISHPRGSAADGSGVFRIGRPTATAWTNATLFLVSAGGANKNSLVTASGSGQTPNVTIGTIEPFLPGMAALALNVETVSAVVHYLDADGTSGASVASPKQFRLQSVVVEFPTDRSTIDHFDLLARWYKDNTYAEVLFERVIRVGVNPPPTGNWTTDGPSDWWDLPENGERLKLFVRVFNFQNTVTDNPTESADLAVLQRPTPGAISDLAAAVFTQGENWGVEGNFTAPSDRTLLETINIYIDGPLSGGDSLGKRLIAQYTDVKSTAGPAPLADFKTDGKWQRPSPEWGESTQTYQIIAEVIDIYNGKTEQQLGSPLSVDPLEFAPFTEITLAANYSVGAGSFRLVGTARPPSDPECDGLMVYVSRDGGTKYDSVGHVPKDPASTAVMPIDVVTALPATDTTLKVKLVPTQITGRQPKVADFSALDVAVDPAAKPVEDPIEFIPITVGASTTISLAPTKASQQIILELTPTSTGNQPSWSANFLNNTSMPTIWHTGETLFTFVSKDTGGGVLKWRLTAREYPT